MIIPTRRRLIAAGALAPLLALVGCGASEDEIATVRFKVKATVAADGKTYSGIAVHEMRAVHTPKSLIGFQMGRTLVGEATIVDVGQRDALYFLLVDYLSLILPLYHIAGSPGDADETTIAKLKAIRGEVEIPRRWTREFTQRPRPNSGFPFIAAFRDETDPTSVYEVDPDNMEATHGPGARFVRVSIEVVDPETPLTDELTKRLPWLDLDNNNPLIHPAAYLTNESTELGRRITSRSFRTRS